MLMRWRLLLHLAAASVFAQSFAVTPQKISQGEVLRIEGEGAETARMNGRTIRLFPQPGARPLGLMPVPVITKPGVYQLELLDQQETVLQSFSITVLNAHYAKENILMGRSVAALKPSPGEQETVTAFQNEVLPERYWNDHIQLPIPGCVTSPFGVRRFRNGKPTGNFHAGLDQRGAVGTPIQAVAGGVVKIARDFNLHGGTIAIDHGQGLQSIYLHMSKLAAREGDSVKAGDIIGYVGSTGRATGPHLHWAIYVNGVAVNPRQWVNLPPPCGNSRYKGQ